VLALAVAALVLAGCGGMGSGGSSQGSSQGSGQGEEAPEIAGSSGGKGSSDVTKPDRERASEDGGRLEHPTLGSARAPVVLTEYSDYQ
jgi:hypothetical protein